MTAEENKKLILAHYESFVHQQDAGAVRKQFGNPYLTALRQSCW